MNGAAGEVNNVGGTRAVNVGKADAASIEEIGPVEPWRLVHGNLGAETAITKIRPIAYFAVSNADQVGEPVARQVSKKNRFSPIGKDQRGPFFLVQWLGRALCPTKAFRGQ